MCIGKFQDKNSRHNIEFKQSEFIIDVDLDVYRPSPRSRISGGRLPPIILQSMQNSFVFLNYLFACNVRTLYCTQRPMITLNFLSPVGQKTVRLRGLNLQFRNASLFGFIINICTNPSCVVDLVITSQNTCNRACGTLSSIESKVLSFAYLEIWCNSGEHVQNNRTTVLFGDRL